MMDSSPTSLLLLPPPSNNSQFFFDSSILKTQPKIPKQFIWPRNEACPATSEELKVPLIDLSMVRRHDTISMCHAARQIREACVKHGFFQLVNHGVDEKLMNDALECMNEFFAMSIERKLGCKRKAGSMWGYTGAHADRFTMKLPWKETLSFGYHKEEGKDVVMDYFKSALGENFEAMGIVYQRYCEAMTKLSLTVMELLAISLGVKRDYYRDFFEDASSIMRLNYYPSCQEPELTLGTGPHSDPTALTILQQDQVEGLEVFTEGRWRLVRPIQGALVINIGDTFMALSNGKYKSCLHRAVVNRQKERRSVAFFLCPRENRVIRPPENIDGPRLYPDFTWAELRHFTQKHYRADARTLDAFVKWIDPTFSPSSPN